MDALKNYGIDVITTVEANNIKNSDEEQLVWITNQGRVIYTFNVGDFFLLHKSYLEQDKQHSGIIVVTKQSYSIGQQLRAILKLIADKSAEDMSDKLIFLNNYVYSTR